MLKSEPNSVGPVIQHEPRRTIWNLELCYCGPHMSISRQTSAHITLKKHWSTLSYNVLVSSIQQSESVLHVYISVPLFLGYFPVTFRPLQNIESRSCATHWILIGCLLSYSSVFMAIPVSQCIASPAYPLVTVRLFSTSMT